MGLTYEDAGVDITAGGLAVDMIKPAVARTHRPEVLSGLGGFAGLFALDVHKYPDPVLVSGTDGVGTKLRLAFQMEKHDTIGIDAVAMCVNDILVLGAEPLFYLDYIAVGKLEPAKMAAVVGGVAAGCEMAHCALIGGEMAEMPGFYGSDEYDIAGFAVGVVNRDRLLDHSSIRPGDVLIGLPSSGLHSNGFSLARKIFAPYSWDTSMSELLKRLDLGMESEREAGQELTLGEVLLTPTRIYVRPVLALLETARVEGMVHITGGGFTENVPRVLPEGCGADIVLDSWRQPPVFALLQKLGGVADAEMFRTFNMGIGFVIVARREEAERVMETLRRQGEKPLCIGSVRAGEGVRYL